MRWLVWRGHSCPRALALGFLIGKRVNPQIAGSGWSGMRIKHSRAVARERRAVSRRPVQSLRQSQGSRFARSDVVKININVPVHVRGIDERLAIRCEACTRNLPLFLGEPMDLLGRDLEQADVLVS